MRYCRRLLMFVLAATAVGCGDEADPASPTRACDAEPEVMTTDAGVQFVRTPDACFVGLPDWPYAPKYVDIDGLRQAYVDEGPPDGEVVLLLHGQGSLQFRRLRDLLTMLP